MTPEVEPLLRLAVDQQPPWTIVRALGELDWNSCGQFRECLATILSQDGPPSICLDLTGLDFCDSSGIACLVHALRKVSERGGQLIALRPNASLTRQMIRLGLAGQLPIMDHLPGHHGPASSLHPTGDRPHLDAV